MNVTLLGVLNGIWMLVLHVRYKELGSICSITQKVSCEVLTYKQYSEWFGIPVPLFAFFTFLIMFLLSAAAWKKKQFAQPMIDAYVWILSTVSAVAMIWMVYVSFIVLKKACLFCIVFYVLITICWILSKSILKATSQGQCSSVVKQQFGKAFTNKWVYATLIAVGALIFFSRDFFHQAGTLNKETFQFKGDSAKTSGNPNASVAMVIFSDFQCPACKMASQTMREIEDKYSSKIKITYKFFPLDPSCNKNAPYGQHLMACDAAKAALCAAQQNKFWRYHDHLFANQTSLYERKLLDFAGEENLNMDQFEDCFRSKAVLEEVQKDIQEGVTSGVDATPSIYLNGKKYKGSADAEALGKTIDDLLKGKSA